jgi:hypothetical protein
MGMLYAIFTNRPNQKAKEIFKILFHYRETILALHGGQKSET